MKTRYIFSMGELKRKDNSIAFKNEKGWHYLPIENLRELYLFNEVSLNTKLLDFLARAGVVVHFFNYYGSYSGTFFPKRQYISGKLTILQAKAHLEQRLEIAAAIVKATARNMYTLLYHYYRHGANDLKETLDWLRETLPIMVDKCDSIQRLLFVEGQIWLRFYAALPHFLPEDFLIDKRVKRPPDNPMNALISFGNTLLYTKMITALFRTHLDQSISFLHEPRESRYSLSLDLSEAFKPVVVFRTIFELVNRRRLQVAKHFEKKLNYALLNEEGRKIFIEAFEKRLNEKFKHTALKRMVSYQTAFRYDGYKLAKYLLEGKPFEPFLMEKKR